MRKVCRKLGQNQKYLSRISYPYFIYTMNPESNILSSNNITYKTIHSIVLPVLIDGIIGLNISYWLFLFTFKLKYKYDMFLFNNFSLKYRHKYLEQLPRSNNKINLVEARTGFLTCMNKWCPILKFIRTKKKNVVQKLVQNFYTHFNVWKDFNHINI